MSEQLCDPLVALAALTPKGWGGIRRSAALTELVLTSGQSQAVCAMRMRQAVREGLAARSGRRTIEQTWVITPKGEVEVEQSGGIPPGLELHRARFDVDGRRVA